MNSHNHKFVFLHGGLGNQLFQLSFGLNLEILKKFKIKYEKCLLTKLPKKIQPRDYELDLFLDSSKVMESTINLYKYLYFKNKCNKKNFYIEKTLNDKHLELIASNTKFISGYFQNYTYVDNVWDTLERSFRSLLVKHFAPDEKYITVHIRLGDYRTNKQANDTHGTLSNEYYLAGLNYLLDNTSPRYIRIVSDEILIARDILDISKFKIPVVYDSNKNHFDNLSKIGNSMGVVMSNSSFSWWGAYAAEKFQNALVVAPKQWFKSDLLEAPNNLIKPNWQRI